jgi:uncharacterized protein (TIGR01244 family)
MLSRDDGLDGRRDEARPPQGGSLAEDGAPAIGGALTVTSRSDDRWQRVTIPAARYQRRVCMRYAGLLMMVLLPVCGLTIDAQQVTREDVPGIRNFARAETTVACAGAITPESAPAIKRMGFVSIVNLRLATEEGANVEKEEAAAKAVGLRYYHVPYDGSADPNAAEAFLDVITTPGAEPAFIHCSGGNRAATMWLIKRIAVDHWDVKRATDEATLLGQTNSAIRQFAVDYAQAHRR